MHVGLRGLAVRLGRRLQRELLTKAGRRESIVAVYAEQGDGGRRLIDPMLYTFDRARGVLELVTGALGATETGVAVEVENPCVIPPD